MKLTNSFWGKSVLLIYFYVAPVNAQVVTTFAGSGAVGVVNAIGTSASFNHPRGVAVDLSGNVYVADRNNHCIRKINPAGVVTTFAGSGIGGFLNGTALTAKFNFPVNATIDLQNNIYVADHDNNAIRKITPAGIVSTFAGSGLSGATNGIGTSASFNEPFGLAADAIGNIYVADAGNHMVRKISPSGIVSTLAGSGTGGNSNGISVAASFNRPMGVAVDVSGNVYVADAFNNKIRKISSTGVVTTLAGSGTPGSANGTGTSASFYRPIDVAVDISNNIYVTDGANNLIRKISPTGVVSTLAGSGVQGSANGTASTARFSFPIGIIIDANNNIYIGDESNNLIRKISVQPNCNNITFSNVMATCHGVSPGAGTPTYALVPQFTNNSGLTITNFVVSTTQATILSGGTQSPFGTGANIGTSIIFSNPAPMPVFFDFTFTLSNNTQCMVRAAVDYPNCPVSSCTCAAWPSQINYGISPNANSTNVSGSVSNNTALVLQDNMFLNFPGISAPCSSTSCQGSITYELYGPSNNLIPTGANGINFSTKLKNQPCSNSGVYKLVIKSKCGNTNCPIPFTIIISKLCPPAPPMTFCGTPRCTADDTNTNFINLSVSGGTSPFTYLWSNGTTAQNLTSVMPGNYSVTVTDANGYKTTASFTISCLPRCNFLQTPNRIVTINSGQSVVIGIAPEPGITYSWFSNPVGFTSTLSNPTVSPTVTTTYTLIRRNSNPGCPPKTSTVVVTVN